MFTFNVSLKVNAVDIVTKLIWDKDEDLVTMFLNANEDHPETYNFNHSPKAVQDYLLGH